MRGCQKNQRRRILFTQVGSETFRKMVKLSLERCIGSKCRVEWSNTVIKNVFVNLTIARGEWGGDSGKRGLQELL